MSNVCCWDTSTNIVWNFLSLYWAFVPPFSWYYINWHLEFLFFPRAYLLPICDNISSQGIDVILKLGYFLHATISFIRYKILNYHFSIFVKISLQYLCKDSMSFVILEVVNTSIAEITENYFQNIHNQKVNSLPLMPKNIEVNVLDSSICIFISHHWITFLHA